MSLLTDTQGKPERVWSLVSLLRAHGGELEREGIEVWLDPFNTKGTAIDQTIGAATSLKLIEKNRNGQSVRLIAEDLPDTLDCFADWVHARLVSTPPQEANSIMLEVYAWFLASSAREKGNNWIQKISSKELAEKISNDLTPQDQENRFNSTKYPHWREWITFVGLGLDLDGIKRGLGFYPYSTARLERQMSTLRLQFGTGEEIGARAFVSAVVQEMPYLDFGQIFTTAASRVRFSPPTRELSVVFSTALRDLDDEGQLVLRMFGDARDAIRLHPDPTQKKEAFVSVVLNPERGSDG